MTRYAWQPLWLALVSLSIACSGSSGSSSSNPDGDSGDDGGVPDTQAGDGSNCSPGNTVLLSDSNNYKFKGSLSIKSYTLGALSDPVFDWSGLTKDLQGHALAQSDINYSAIIVFINLTQEQIEAELTSNTISQSSIEAYVSLDTTGITSARMDQYTLFGNPIGIETEFTASTGVWMLTLASGTTAGSGTRMAASSA